MTEAAVKKMVTMKGTVRVGGTIEHRNAMGHENDVEPEARWEDEMEWSSKKLARGGKSGPIMANSEYCDTTDFTHDGQEQYASK